MGKDDGSLTARERIELLLDGGSFLELNPGAQDRPLKPGVKEKSHRGEGVITGSGTIWGRRVFIYAQDFSVMGGSLGEMQAAKIAQVQDLALENGAPLIALNDSVGARIQAGVLGLSGFGRLFYRHTLASGVIPQISVIMGSCAGGAVYAPALTDFVIMVNNKSRMFLTGPKVVKSVTGEVIAAEELGGAQVHNSISGTAHFLAQDEVESLELVRNLLSYLPQNNLELPPHSSSPGPGGSPEELEDLVPKDPHASYDVRQVIANIMDAGDFLEVQAEYAQNLVVGFSRLEGRSVGVVANQPMVLAGCLDSASSNKLARFVRFCDCFNIPIITLVDVPGYLPGREEEHNGVIRHGAKVLYAYSEASVPQITVILRKAFGGSYIAIAAKSLELDAVFAWPQSEIAVMGPEGAVDIIYKNELEQTLDKESLRRQLEQDYKRDYSSPHLAAAHCLVNDVIEPRHTRQKIITTLAMLENKTVERPQKKHGNIPL